MFNKERIDYLEEQLIMGKERIHNLEEKMSALQDLLNLSFTPRIIQVTHTRFGDVQLDSEVNIEPSKFTFINRFPEKVKKNKEKKVITKKKK